MIQLVTYGGQNGGYSQSIIKQYSFTNIESIDEYEITVIDMSDDYIWMNRGTGTNIINGIEDIKIIADMIKRSKKTKILIILPQNSKYKYYHKQGSYTKECKLNKITWELSNNILNQLYDELKNFPLKYENIHTEINGVEYEAAFCFDNVCDEDVIIESDKSQKPIAIETEKAYITTLKICNEDQLLNLLRQIGFIREKESYPDWMKDVNCFDDLEKKELIKKCDEKIDEMNTEKVLAEESLSKNMHYKSILFSSGDDLVEVVLEILDEMLNCNASDFVDEKKEDFLFECNDNYYIGEIKGIKPNVKAVNVSQLEVHYRNYLDENNDVSESNLKGLLIINHQRDKHPSQREDVPDEHIKLAERNGSLIIETTTLLQMLEDYRIGKLSRESVIELLWEKTGLLEYPRNNS